MRQVAGKIAGEMISNQIIMPENFAEWTEVYYRIMMGYPLDTPRQLEGEGDADTSEVADIQQQGD